MSGGWRTETYRMKRWRGQYVIDLAWSGVLVAPAFLAARWFERLGAAPVLAVYLMAVVLAGAGRGVRSGIAAAISVVALCALRLTSHRHIPRVAPLDLSILLTGFMAVTLTSGYAVGRLSDKARRLATRRRALLSLAASYVRVTRPADPAEAGRKLTRWFHSVMGLEACYLALQGAQEIRAAWPSTDLERFAVTATTQPRRTLRSGELRLRALGHGREVVGVLAWRSPRVSREDGRNVDLIVGELADFMTAAWNLGACEK